MTFELHFDSIEARDEFLANSFPDGVSYSIDALNSGDGDYHTFVVFLDIARDVGVGLVSAWLYDKIKHKPAKIEYRRKEIHCKEGEIRRVIEEHLKIGGDDE